MRPDTGHPGVRRNGLASTLVAVVLVVGLALVAPAAGPARGGAHDFLAVHPLFPHHHDAYVSHDAVAAVDGAEDDAPISDRQPALASAGPIGDAAGLASKGLAMAGLLLALALRAGSLGAGLRVPVPPQRWDAVPIRPPR